MKKQKVVFVGYNKPLDVSKYLKKYEAIGEWGFNSPEQIEEAKKRGFSLNGKKITILGELHENLQQDYEDICAGIAPKGCLFLYKDSYVHSLKEMNKIRVGLDNWTDNRRNEMTARDILISKGVNPFLTVVSRAKFKR